MSLKGQSLKAEMRNRFFIIMSCACLLGMMVVQALAVPCCCKTPSQYACAKHSSAGEVNQSKKTCSHVGHSKATSDLANHSRPESGFPTIISHHCRCFQVSNSAALYIQEASYNDLRVPSAPVAAQTLALYSQPVHGVDFLPDLVSRSIALHLATCTLRC